MLTAHHALLALGLVAAAPCAAAEDTMIAGLADELSPMPGATIITKYDGPLPSPRASDGSIPQMGGWPTSMGVHLNFKPSRGLIFIDLDGDSNLEVITSSTDSRIYAWNKAGEAMPGFPVNTIGWAQYAPSAADMDGDGDVEIVQLTRGLTSGGRLYVIDHLGNNLPGFPISVNNNNLSSCPTLYDLDRDGAMEIIIGERAYPLGYIHVYELDGTEWLDAWPVEIDHVPTCSAAVGDVDNDGEPEVFYASYNSMYLIEANGAIMAGWPKQIASANFSYQSAALADLDNDGDLEVVVGAHKDAAGCYVFHHDGTGYPGFPKLLGTWTYCPPTVTDLEGDGVLEILDGRAGFGPGVPSDCFYAWDASGNTKPGFPYNSSTGGGSEGPLTVADIDGDGMMEIFADHNIASGGQGYLFGVDASGNDLPGFPLRPEGFTYLNGATIGDVDNDGDYELGVISYTDSLAYVNLYDLPDLYAPTARDWTVYHARNTRGGLYPSVSLCPADINGDGTVDVSDLLMLLAAWGSPGAGGEDINGDGIVDVADLLLLLAAWGPC